MRNGGVENVREHEHLQAKRNSGGDEFAHAVARLAVAQICENAGFQNFQQSALETLSDVAVRYIHNIGKTANLYASLAGRTEGNVFDIIQGLEDMGSGLGFAGASDVDHCLATSGVVRDIVRYIGEVEVIPFTYPVPSFPVVKDRKLTSSFSQIGVEPPDEHIPAWLPAFPDPQKCIHLEKENEITPDFERDKIEQASQIKAEEPSLSSQQHLARNRLAGSLFIEDRDSGKAKQAAESNPFLATPLQFDEKPVSCIVRPTKLSDFAAMKDHVPQNHVISNHATVLETIAPVIEAPGNGLCISDERMEILKQKRPLVQFRIRTAKKSISSALEIYSTNKRVEKVTPWFGKDELEEREDKKSRKTCEELIDLG